MTAEGEAVLAAMREVVDRSTYLVCPREQVPPHVVYQARHPDTGRPLIFVHPTQVDRITAGLRIVQVPHEMEGPPDGTA